MGSFDPRITALSGGAAHIARAARAFDAHYDRIAGGEGSYAFDHTTTVYLVGRDGKIAGTANLRTPEADRQRMLTALLAGR